MSCSGTNAYRYGTMKEWVISLTAVLADGRIIKTHQRPRKSSAGYDLTHLIIGSEGTLALVTEAVLRLTNLPQNLHVGIATFATFQQGVDISLAIQKSGHKLEAMELADGPSMHCLNVSKLSEQHFEEIPTLLFKIAGPSQQVVSDQITLVNDLLKSQNALSSEITSSPERITTLWDARKNMGNALVAMKNDPSDLFIHSDCAVPISNLTALVNGTQDLITRASASAPQPWFCCNIGHIGDGNVHSAIICPASDKGAVDRVLLEVSRLALRLEGTVTGEHGVGMKLRGSLVEEVGSVGTGVMRSVKGALDERGILNPDKVFWLEEGREREEAKL